MLDNLKKYDIVLASGSPRRHQLLRGLDIDFTVALSEGIDETYPAGLPAEQIPQYLSQLKAQSYRVKHGQLLITADTVVILDDNVLGKPDTVSEARKMLRALSGRTHHVVTGVTVTTAERTESFSCTTEVTFCSLGEDEINYYVERYKPFDKAGAYGIQEWIGYTAILDIKGSFYNVMGLPVQRLYTLLKTF